MRIPSALIAPISRSRKILQITLVNAVLVIGLASVASAISFTQIWAIDGDLSDTYSLTVVNADLDSVSGGVVSLSDNGSVSLVTISAATVTGGASSFDVSTFPLTLTLNNSDTSVGGGNDHLGIFIGSDGTGKDFIWHPHFPA